MSTTCRDKVRGRYKYEPCAKTLFLSSKACPDAKYVTDFRFRNIEAIYDGYNKNNTEVSLVYASILLDTDEPPEPGHICCSLFSCSYPYTCDDPYICSYGDRWTKTTEGYYTNVTLQRLYRRAECSDIHIYLKTMSGEPVQCKKGQVDLMLHMRTAGEGTLHD